MPASTYLSFVRRLKPDTAPISYREQARSAIGALIGIFVTGMIGIWPLGGESASLPFLIAPMGASSVLLFAVPASPLAQPWSLLAGNLCAALVGVTVARFVGDPVIGAALAAGLSIALMISFGCLHPPSGAVALTAVLGGKAVHDLGYFFVLWPVAANSLALLATALVYNRLVGRRYPHRHTTMAAAEINGIGFERSDLDAVLRDYDAILDIDADDLEYILRRTELRALTRRTRHLQCAGLMTPAPPALSPDASLTEVLRALRASQLHVLPVTDDTARILGVVTQGDFLGKVSWAKGRPVIGLGRRMALALDGAPAPNGTARDIMTTTVRCVSAQTALSEAIALFAQTGLHHLPVVNDNNKLVGMLAQSDVLAGLLDAAQAHGKP
ncbi:HPP family protein [Allorhizobium undicola]|uniref:HPP family protein n=1 Tax=Allorhizobium undicola TaxID=78527 RepID=UPI0004862CA5|nr:HPP family protein [Allorhizobium undicola]